MSDAQQTVTVFSTTYCQSCAALKKWLDSKGVAYESVNLEDHPERQAEVMQKSGGLSVPVTIVANQDGQEQVVNGPNYAELSSILKLNAA